MRRLPVLLLIVLSCAPILAAEQKSGDGWWNPAWSCRKRVRVPLPETQPFSFSYKPPQAVGEDLVAAEAMIRSEVALQGGPHEIRVVDAGGNQVPCVAEGPDARGTIRVTFAARRTIAGQLATEVGATTDRVELTVGRDKAVTPGLQFRVLAGADRVATLEVVSVADKASTARVADKTAPTIAKGTPVRSADLRDAEYAIYYGNPKPEGESTAWTPPAAPVTQYTWLIKEGSDPTSVALLQQVMRSDLRFIGSCAREQINTHSSTLSLDSDSSYISAYETYVECEIGGLYRFALDTDGPSFLFFDGKFAAQRPGYFHQTRQWEHRGKIYLTPGYHQLVLFVGESPKRPVSRLGWQPVTEKVYSLVPVRFFAPRVRADVVAFETREKRQQTFFSYTVAPRSILAPNDQRCQFVQFQNRTTVQPAGKFDTVTYLWDFGDGEKSRDASPGHLFALPKSESAPSFPVTLRAYLGARPAGEYICPVICDPRPGQKLLLALDTVSFANIVYDDERTSIAIRLRNDGYSPIMLRAVGRLQHKGSAQAILSRLLQIQAENEDFCILPVDMKTLRDKHAVIQLDFFIGSQRVAGTSARIIPSPHELSSLTRGLGALYDAEGRRIMICAQIENQDSHFRWLFPRALRDEVIDRATGSRRRILLFGDRMSNPIAPGKPFTDYVTLLQQRLERDKRQFQFVPRSTGLLPTLADLTLFSKTLDSLKPLPDIIVLSPGLADVAQATYVRDFARSIDVMIDRIRATGHRTKIVIVSPPPFPGNPELSRHDTDAIARVAKDHRIPLVNLQSLLTRGQDDWLKAYYATPDAEGIFFQNPNEAAHRLIAEAILKELY